MPNEILAQRHNVAGVSSLAQNPGRHPALLQMKSDAAKVGKFEREPLKKGLWEAVQSLNWGNVATSPNKVHFGKPVQGRPLWALKGGCHANDPTFGPGKPTDAPTSCPDCAQNSIGPRTPVSAELVAMRLELVNKIEAVEMRFFTPPILAAYDELCADSSRLARLANERHEAYSMIRQVIDTATFDIACQLVPSYSEAWIDFFGLDRIAQLEIIIRQAPEFVSSRTRSGRRQLDWKNQHENV
jgi:hypothetical protein